ncbi:MAG: SOS response-associated peptidase, partial [Solirubrobacterales bacterium]
MCGRYTLANANPDVLKARFGIDILSDFDERPRFNIAPTDLVLGIRTGAGGRREAGRLRWGLLPGEWANDGGRPLINARAERIAEQPAFRDSSLHRRCLIPADGFYEWRASEIGKQPAWISRADEAPFAFAGIWATLDDREDAVHSCAIVTCEPNELVRPIHDRMPVILTPDAEGSWIGEGEPDALM